MLKFIKNKKIIFFAIFVLALILISDTLATIRPRMQTDWPVSPMGTGLDVGSTITDLVQYFYEWGIALGGLIAFIALIIAGFLYLTSVGDPEKMKQAKDRIVSAFLGLALLLGSWLILHTINPELTILREIKFDPDAIPRVDLVPARLMDKPEPCDSAMLFKDPNFQGTSKTIPPSPYARTGAYTDFRSFVFCRTMTEQEKNAEIGGKVVENALYKMLFDYIRGQRVTPEQKDRHEDGDREWARGWAKPIVSRARKYYETELGNLLPEHRGEKANIESALSTAGINIKRYMEEHKDMREWLTGEQRETIANLITQAAATRHRPLNDKCRAAKRGVFLIEGGACTLQLYDGWALGLGCGGPTVEIVGSRMADVANIMTVANIRCLRVIATAF
ncbi:MAG: pilin [Candidatus Nealsonbacteria bacterium]|nr:pilin [Candidatus Nealsonbacteria bacterium]